MRSRKGFHGIKRFLHTLDLRHNAVFLIRRRDQHHAISRSLELSGHNAVHVSASRGEADKCRRYIQVFKAAGHRVLAANGANAQVNLRHERAQKRRRGFAPARRIFAQAAKVFLERKVCILARETGSDKLRDAFHNGNVRAHKLVALGQIRVITPAHTAARGGLAVNGKLCDHGHVRRELRLAAKRHKHRSRTDRAVEALGKALVGRHVDIGQNARQTLFKRGAFRCSPRGSIRTALLHVNIHALRCAVAVQERARKIDNRIVVPGHTHARLLRNNGNRRGFQIFLVRKRNERVHVFGGKRHRHALLALGNGQLRAVQAVVFLRHAVQIDLQAVGQLAHGNGNAARAKVVAALDHATCIATAEQTLNLAFNRRVALLDLGTARLNGARIVRLRGTRGAADAVAARATAQKDNDIGGSRRLAANVVGRRGTHNRAHFHVLCGITRVIHFADLARCQANLVAVARITRSCRGCQLALRQLARDGFGNRHQRISAPGQAHGLVHVAAAGKWVANSAAHARCRAAERLDLSGMVVRLVLEKIQPILLFPVHVALDFHRAGVDFFGLVQILQDALRLQILRANSAHVHKANGFLVATQLMAHGKVFLEGGSHGGVVDHGVREFSAKRSVAAVIGPVRVNNLDFSNSGIALFYFAEMLLEEHDVGQIHGQAALFDERRQLLFGQVSKALYHFNGRGLGKRHGQRSRQIKGRLAALNRVDNVMLHGFDILLGKRTFQHVHFRIAHQRTLTLTDKLDAFACAIGALIELARQRLNGKQRTLGAFDLRKLKRHRVGLRLAEHGGHALGEQLFGQPLRIVAIDDANLFQTRNA